MLKVKKDFWFTLKTEKVCVALLIAFYTVILLWGIVFKCNMNDELNIDRNLAMSLWERFTQRLIPFQDIVLSIMTGSFWSCMAFVFNVICFIPLGVLLRFYFKNRNVVYVCLAFSAAVEIFQLFSGFGGFDLTDLFLNALGGFTGAILYQKIRPLLSQRTVNIILLSMVAPAFIFALFVFVRTIIYFPI
jgi:glycopeptide antibiotics resistance protein